MKVLHVEDNSYDAELVHQLVVAEWPDCVVTVVTTEDTFRAELERGEIDVILSDFSLPNFSGLGALELAKRHVPGTPFIFISGSIGEDRAIEAVKSGARDYIWPRRGNCRPTSSGTRGTANGTAAPTSTTANRSVRRRTSSARSIPCRKAGR
jgi:CheY-like chemotaxis protein